MLDLKERENKEESLEVIDKMHDVGSRRRAFKAWETRQNWSKSTKRPEPTERQGMNSESVQNGFERLESRESLIFKRLKRRQEEGRETCHVIEFMFPLGSQSIFQSISLSLSLIPEIHPYFYLFERGGDLRWWKSQPLPKMVMAFNSWKTEPSYIESPSCIVNTGETDNRVTEILQELYTRKKKTQMIIHEWLENKRETETTQEDELDKRLSWKDRDDYDYDERITACSDSITTEPFDLVTSKTLLLHSQYFPFVCKNSSIWKNMTSSSNIFHEKERIFVLDTNESKYPNLRRGFPVFVHCCRSPSYSLERLSRLFVHCCRSASYSLERLVIVSRLGLDETHGMLFST